MPTTTGRTRIRPEVTRLARWAPLPAEGEWTDTDLTTFEGNLLAVTIPLTEPERDLLIPLLDRDGEDDLFGMAFTVVHLLESEPSRGWISDLPTQDRPWYQYLRDRLPNELASTTDQIPRTGDRHG